MSVDRGSVPSDLGAAPLPVSGGASATSPASATLPARTDAYGTPARWRGRFGLPIVRGIIAFLVGSLAAGLVSGLVWHAVVDLPTYTVADDGGASTTERGLTKFFATDAWFSLVGGVVGLLVGWLAWRGFRRLGWPVTLLAMGAALVASLACWRVGVAMGPGNFDTRIFEAQAGDVVPIQFKLHTWTSFLVWQLAAVLPVMFGSSLGRDNSV